MSARFSNFDGAGSAPTKKMQSQKKMSSVWTNVKNDDARAEKTLEAMRTGFPLIYHGRIVADDLVGEPDLLRLENGAYVPGDIKAGAGEEGTGEDSKPKKRYAVQLALYVDVLERLGFSDGKRRVFVWDVQ